MTARRFICRTAAVLVAAGSLLPLPAAAAQERSPTAAALFENKVRALLAKACFACHATILHLLGLDHERLTYRHAGRDYRLTDVAAEVVLPTVR